MYGLLSLISDWLIVNKELQSNVMLLIKKGEGAASSLQLKVAFLTTFSRSMGETSQFYQNYQISLLSSLVS